MRWLCALSLIVFAASQPVRAETDAVAISEHAYALFDGAPEQQRAVLEAIVESKRADAAPILIMALRFSFYNQEPILRALEVLTAAHPGDTWDAWMKWQEAHPETGTIPGFAKLQSRVYQLIDPNFKVFLDPDAKNEIRREEIVWGGVVKDGIPALTNPKLIAAGDASYMNDSDLVFGIAINGDVRAYPLRIMDWHEMSTMSLAACRSASPTARCVGRAFCLKQRSRARAHHLCLARLAFYSAQIS